MTDSTPPPIEKKSGFARLFRRKKAVPIDTQPEQIGGPSAELNQTAAVKEKSGVEKHADIDSNDSAANDIAAKTDSIDGVADEPTTIESGLGKSRSSLLSKIGNVFKGSFDLDDALFDDLEEVLLTSDIGVDASLRLVESLRARVKADKIQDANGVLRALRAEIAQMLKPAEEKWDVLHQRPYVILMVGVNGVGKTTTTAKIAKRFQDQGKSVMLAAADTFRAAAVEQLQEWGQRMDIPVVAQSHGSDAAAVAHDALNSAIVKGTQVLLIDTAGRLHTQTDLMEQLQKVKRVLANLDPSMPHEIMQILDAGTGQNAQSQLEHFQKAVGVTSICLTKLDGSAKGGIAISLTEKYKLPIRFIGIGEGYNDLREFEV